MMEKPQGRVAVARRRLTIVAGSFLGLVLLGAIPAGLDGAQPPAAPS